MCKNRRTIHRNKKYTKDKGSIKSLDYAQAHENLSAQKTRMARIFATFFTCKNQKKSVGKAYDASPTGMADAPHFRSAAAPQGRHFRLPCSMGHPVGMGIAANSPDFKSKTTSVAGMRLRIISYLPAAAEVVLVLKSGENEVLRYFCSEAGESSSGV
jgi:hypothetical protein